MKATLKIGRKTVATVLAKDAKKAMKYMSHYIAMYIDEFDENLEKTMTLKLEKDKYDENNT